MIKFDIARKITAVLANFSLFLNSFLPFVLAIQPVRAQSPSSLASTIEYNSSTHNFHIAVNTTEKLSYQLIYKTDTQTESVTGDDISSDSNFSRDIFAGTCSEKSCLPHNIKQGIFKVNVSSSSWIFSKSFDFSDGSFKIVQQEESLQFDLTDAENNFLNNGELTKSAQWTFEKVELNKEYVAPQNSQVKLTFTKLPINSGNIKIEEITLTKEQIEQTGSLSDKAYDITSDMVDGSFTYNLSLPIPESSKGKAVDVKFAEDISKIDSTQTVENTTTKTDTSVSIKSLDHLTIFIIVGITDNPKVRLNEFVYDPATGNKWIELYNNENDPINLSGWELGGLGGRLNLSGTINSHSFIVFDVDWLNNNGDTIYLRKGLKIIDSLIYYRCDRRWCASDNPVSSDNNMLGKSIGRTTDGGSSWTSFSNPTKNFSNIPDTTAPDTPTLISPDDNIYRHTSDSNYSDWSDVTDSPSVVYRYQSAADISFTNLYYDSNNYGPLTESKIMNPGEPEVSYFWRVQACDTLGNCSAWSSPRKINVDNTAPSVPINGNPDTTTIATNNFNFTWNNSTDSSPITYEFQSSLNPTQDSGVLTSGLWKSGTLPNNMIHSSGAPDGTWYWQVRAIDAVGNTSAWSQIWNVTLDTKAPTVTITYSNQNPTNQSVIATLVPDNNEPIIVTNNNGELTHTFSANGSFTFEFKDSAGNTGSALASVSNIDTTAPSTPTGIYFKDTTNNKNIACGGKTNTKHLDVYWAANSESDFDHYEYVSFNYDGSTGPIRTFTSNYFNASWWTIPSEGTYGVQIRAVDKAGNKSNWFGGLQGVNNSCQYIVDWTPPIITIGSYITTPTNQNITVTASTNEGTLDKESYTFTENGSTTFTATDTAGNITTQKVTITNIDKIAPTVSITNPIDHSIINGLIEIKGTVGGDNLHHYWLAIYKKSNNQQIYSTTVNHSNEFVNKLLYSWNTVGQSDGEYQIKFAERDAANNRTPDFIVDVTIDNTAPTVVSVDSDGQTYNVESSNPTIKVTFNENIINTPNIEIFSPVGTPQTVNDCNDLDAKTFCFDYNLSSEDATHTIQITNAQDIAGNTMNPNNSHTFNVNRVVPLISSITTNTPNGAYSVGQVIDFVVTFNKVVNVAGGIPEFSVSAGPGRKATYSSGSGTTTLIFNYTVATSDGTPNYLFANGSSIDLNGSTIKDLNNNIADLTLPDKDIFLATHSIIIDTTAPISTITSPTSSQYFNHIIDISGNTQDTNNIAQLNLSVANFTEGTCGEYSPLVTLTPTENTNNYSWNYSWTPNGQGSYCLKAAGVDIAGNEEHSAIVTNIIYDTVNPAVTFTSVNPNSGLTNKNDHTFTVSVDEEVQSCTLNFNGNYVERQIANNLSDGSGFNLLQSTTDDAYAWYNLPFTFPFYGHMYNGVSVSTNALFNFQSGDAQYSNSDDRLKSKIGFAPLWDDLYANIMYRNETNAVRFRWEGRYLGDSSSSNKLNTEAVMRQDGTIEYHYGNVNLTSSQATIGLSAGNGTDYVFSSLNNSSQISPISFAYSPGAQASYTMTDNGNNIYSVDVQDIADGDVNYSVTCTDLANNDGISESRSMTVDTQAPILSEKTEFGDQWYNTDQTSTFVFTDENSVVSGNNPTCIISTEGVGQTCSVDLNVCDAAGNCNTETAISNGANIDKTNPIIGVSVKPTDPDASNGWYKTQPEISLTVTDMTPSTLQYQWDSQIGEWINYLNPLKPTTEGVHTLYFRSQDSAGNKSSGFKEVKWDQTNPEFGPQNITADPNPTSGSTSKIKWEKAKDSIGIDKYEVKWKLNDDKNPVEYSKTVDIGTSEVEIDKLVEGRWTVSVTAFDQSGLSMGNSIDLYVDRSGPLAPTLTLTGTGAGTATLSWNAIDDAKDYIIWYGSVQGIHNFGARVGNVTSYTVKGLGSGNYYFIVKAVDAAQNQSSDSNEVNTGNISGAPGTTPGQTAEGFSPEVKGVSTESNSNNENVLGANSTNNGFNWWWLLLILFIIPLYANRKKIFKKKKRK